MKNIYEFNKPIPFSLIIKLNISRIVVIWEGLARYFYRLLLIVLLFSILILTELFSFLNFWLHSIILIIFLLFFAATLVKLIFRFKWPSKIDCARRLEKDNNVKNTPFSSLFDKPIQNKNSILWSEHYKRILKISLSLSIMKLKFLNSQNDPLFVRLPIIIVFLFIFMAFNSDIDKKVYAALTPERSTIEFTTGEFTGWINPPEYTKLQPALIGKKAESLIVPEGSSLSARVFGGEGKVELGINDNIINFIKIISFIDSCIGIDVRKK